MQTIRLQDLIPEAAEFSLRITGKTYRLRPFNLADEAWLHQTFGEQIQKIFEEIRMQEIARIVFHQLEPESQREFAAQEVRIIDEATGEEKVERIGGATLLYQVISGFDEKLAIFRALMQTIGVSRQLLDGELEQAEKKSSKTSSQRTGGRSSTYSRLSTAGRSRKSKR